LKTVNPMTPQQVFVPLLTHFVPILYFAFMSIDMLIRDARQLEHRLVSVISLCFMNLFLAEYVRHQLPLEYSPVLAAVWFSTSGILIPGLGFHLFVKLTKLDRGMPRYVYPWIFYLPVILVVVNLLRIDTTISVTRFYETGLWKLPVYNTPYYITMVLCVINNLLYLIPLVIGYRKDASREMRSLYKHLGIGVVLAATWFGIFGLIDFGDALPPYPYLYGGVVWCFFLRRTMRKYDVLNFTDRRFEKLFHLNPAAIFLADAGGNIREANPGAKEMFGSHAVKQDNLWSIMGEDFRELMERQREVKNHEMTITGGGKTIHALIDAGYILVEHQPHILVIIRDATPFIEQQKRIAYLAYHDPLTGLPNRRHFREKLQEKLDRPADRQKPLALLLVDVDNFKTVNDRYGHQTGDEALVKIAALMRDTAGTDGMAARFGGDEFVIFLDDFPDDALVEERVRRLLGAFAQLKIVNRPVMDEVSLSVGISRYPEHGNTIDLLLWHADKKMYQAKFEGKGSDREKSL